MVWHTCTLDFLVAELKESIARMGTDLKQKIIESLRSTWNSLHEFAQAHRRGHVMDDEKGLEREVDQQVDSVMSHMAQQHDDKSDTACKCAWFMVLSSRRLLLHIQAAMYADI